MFIRSHSSLENRTRFQTKVGKVYTRVQTKTAQKPYPLGQHIPTWLTRWSTPPPCGFEVLASFLFFFLFDIFSSVGATHSKLVADGETIFENCVSACITSYPLNC